jgi:two-component system NtrC family response regulator
VAVHLSALPHALVESELFGHEKGAFTGADARRIGRFELARGGTLFLDEIQDIPAEVQPKLLRVLEQRTFERLGGNETLRTDVRIVCACNRDPNMAVADGTLRADLFYRLSGVTIAVPPLRDRPQDIEPLLRHFLHLCGSEKTLDDAAMVRLKRYAWPGNVRELKHCVEALDVLVEGPVIRMEDLPERMRGLTGPEAVGGFEPIAVAVERLERDLYRRAYELADGNNEEAMRLLGVARATYFKRKKLFGLG